MLNFTGQTKRRNVNLGNRSGKSKQDLLINAKIEREKRALARRNEENAIVMQSAIRKHLSNKKTFGILTKDITRTKSLSLAIAYPTAILNIMGSEVLSKVLTGLSNDGDLLLNLRLIRIIPELGYQEYSKEFLISVLSRLSPLNQLQKEFVDAVVVFLETACYDLPKEVLIKVVQLIKAFGADQTQYVASVYGVSMQHARNSNNIRRFLQCLGPQCSPRFLPTDAVSSNLVENLAYILNSTENIDSAAYCHQVLLCVSNMELGSLSGCENFGKLYNREFVDFITSSDSEQLFDKMSVFVKHAPSVESRNNILVSLIAKPGFLMKSHQQALGATTNSTAASKKIYLLVELLNVFLSVASDFEILRNTDVFPLELLRRTTDFLKMICFESMWNESGPWQELPDSFLNTLKKIHLRDSRLHFCSRKKDADYWSISDGEFLNVNITKYIEDYEAFYREKLHSSQSEEDEAENFNLLERKRDIRQEFLSHLELSFSNRPSTRQFRKLGILTKAPFFIPFRQRVEWLYFLISLDRKRLALESNGMGGLFPAWNSGSGSDKQNATISREHLLEDAYNAYNPIGESFKSKLSITFVNEFGPEAGIDGGGITKEFLTSVTGEAFKIDKHKLFRSNNNHEIYPTSNLTSAQSVKFLWFLGKVLGKCLYDHVLINVTFADFFLKKLLNVNNANSSFDDLASLDSELYSNLAKLSEMNAEQLQSLGLRFEVTDEDTLEAVDLMPSCPASFVTKSNVLQYLLAVADYKLNRKLKTGSRAFAGGLYTMIPPHWIEMFNSVELQMLISGGDKDIDLADLRKHTEYGDYSEQHQTVRDFWEILEECTAEERLKFIKFVTSVPRAPLQGFGSLNPLFGIRNAGRETARLPTASTCVNLLKLPDYRNKQLLKTKLLYAINAEARFDLS
ncbi:ubiquitin-ubiquitin ligase HUL5 [Lachancea thermotolerans CBS 6340]|uniref:HECT-type E3 ubiquitin transferase n=1 Tax=Lachancea thermotolerans (strain ATCC 56472 / CBS 6340 / NRRL Y-8284) TaxID=559295 RepID=C5DL33_LACTC|nr:KLTH0F09592p [Lachancea thermotolerans CBS 6340]CAR24184.1 KLTH0F09592p [Lachancea thermotolerans CBS 6340]